MSNKQPYVLWALMLLSVLASGCASSIQLGNRIGTDVFYDSSKTTVSIGNALEKNSVIWEESMYGQFSENNFQTAGRYVFVGDVTGRVYCFDLETGDEVGSLSRRSESLSGGVMVSADILQFVSIKRENVQSSIVTYDLEKGKYISEQEIEDVLSGRLTKYNNGSFYLASKPGRTYKLNDTATLNTKSGRIMSLDVQGNELFIGEEVGILRTFDASSLKLQRIDSLGTEPVVVKSGFLSLYASSGKALYKFQSDSYKLLKKFTSDISDFLPIDSQRVLIALNNGGMCLVNGDEIVDIGKIRGGFAISMHRISQETLSLLTVDGTLFLYSIDSNTLTDEFRQEERFSVHPIPTKFGLIIGLERGLLKLLDF